MKTRRILVTGGAGFIGSSLAIWLKRKYALMEILALDSLKRRGSEQNIPRLKENKVSFVHGDIRCPEDFPQGFKFDVLLECSAEPSVLAGYGDNPLYMVNTNLVGSINCLEAARKNKAGVVFLSTSRVYPYEAINALKITENSTRFIWRAKQKNSCCGWSKKGISADFPLIGAKTLYGATKLASELILQEYIAQFGIRGVINRCGVVAGPGQFGKADQGVFTHWMLAHYFKRPLTYIGFQGKGKQVRDLLHIDDLCALIDIQIRSLESISGRVYNVGGGNAVSLSLQEATKLCQQITGNHIPVGRDYRTRLGDVAMYVTDNSRIFQELGWTPRKSAEEIMRDILNWIKNNEDSLRSIL